VSLTGKDLECRRQGVFERPTVVEPNWQRQSDARDLPQAGAPYRQPANKFGRGSADQRAMERNRTSTWSSIARRNPHRGRRPAPMARFPSRRLNVHRGCERVRRLNRQISVPRGGRLFFFFDFHGGGLSVHLVRLWLFLRSHATTSGGGFGLVFVCYDYPIAMVAFPICFWR